MSEQPEPRPDELETPEARDEVRPAEIWPLEPLRDDPWPGEPLSPDAAAEEALDESTPFAEPVGPILLEHEQAPGETPLFDSFTRPEIVPPTRIPHLGHLLILVLLLILGTLGALILTSVAVHYRLFGVSNADQAFTDVHYALAEEAAIYLITFGACLLVFPAIWHKGFLAGVEWRGTAALRLSSRLIGAAFVCFLLALVNGWLLPSPNNAPIDRMFRVPGAAWLLFGFGVTFAPFFEEIFFRGFLLPSLCTACDWVAEKAAGRPSPPPGADGQPQWSIPAMAVGSVLTSIPFAGMHAEQTGHALGPFLLLVSVSLVLCWARLAVRSLAASVLVHASYNFMLFFFMLLGTGGFKHLE